MMLLPDDTAALSACLERWSSRPLPARATTLREIELLHAREDQVDANRLGELMASDALMTLRLFAQVAGLRSAKSFGDPQTVTAALVWFGVGPFFRSARDIPAVEQTLAGCPAALWHVQRKLAQKSRAARLAFAFAARRGDPDAALLHHAALLDGFFELLVWVFEPSSALRIQSLREAEPSMLPTAAERKILGFEMAALERPLLERWRLPRQLSWSYHARRADDAAVRCVAIASRLAEGECFPDSRTASGAEADLEELGRLLEVDEQQLRALIAEAGQ